MIIIYFLLIGFVGGIIIAIYRTKIINDAIKEAKAAAESYKIKLKKENFTVNKQLVCGTCFLFIDNITKRWALMTGASSLFKIYSFSDLYNFELKEDGSSVAKGNAGKALAGGLLFGVAGAVIGGSSKKQIKSICNRLELNISVNDLNHPIRAIYFINSAVEKNSNIYRNSYTIAKQFAATLSFIQNNAA